MLTSAPRSRHPLPRVLLAGLALLLAGCASVTPIGELLDNSTKYDGKTVRVQGEVTESVGLLGRGGYQIKDKTGQLTVISETAAPPRKGSTINVKGVFQAVATFMDKSLAVLREESRSTP